MISAPQRHNALNEQENIPKKWDERPHLVYLKTTRMTADGSMSTKYTLLSKTISWCNTDHSGVSATEKDKTM